jgi:hypothetical protein
MSFYQEPFYRVSFCQCRHLICRFSNCQFRQTARPVYYVYVLPFIDAPLMTAILAQTFFPFNIFSFFFFSKKVENFEERHFFLQNHEHEDAFTKLLQMGPIS